MFDPIIFSVEATFAALEIQKVEINAHKLVL